MKTRPVLLLIILLLSASVAYAQSSATGNMSFGVLAGPNFSNINGKEYNGDKTTNVMLLGFHVGVNVQIPVAPEFYFQPGLLFSTKGAKSKAQMLFGTNYKSTTTLNYLEVPLNFVYKGALGGGFVMVGLGPYFAFGISGKVKDNYGTTNVKFKSTIELGDDVSVPYVKRFDAGANIFAGYQMAGGLFFQFNTQFGMLKINPEDKHIPNDKTSYKNTGFGVSLGYRF